MLGKKIELFLLDTTVDGSNPPMGPGLTNGYPIELTWSTLAITDFKPDHVADCGVKNTKAGAFGLLWIKKNYPRYIANHLEIIVILE